MKAKKHGSISEHKEKHEHKSKPAKTNDTLPGKNYLLISGIVIVALLALLIFLLVRKPAGQDTGSGDKVKVEFYVMSQCPYGTQVENGIYPVIKEMGDVIDFRLDFIATDSGAGTFTSLHGAKEVAGDIAQLCAIKYYSKDYKFMDLIACQNKDAANVDTNWESCAKDNGMDPKKLSACISSDEGKQLLSDSIKRANARKAAGSPTMYFNDVQYSGGRDAVSFKRAICTKTKTAVAACASIPACTSDNECTAEKGKEGTCENPNTATAKCTYKTPAPVDLIVLNDVKCGTACDPAQIVQVTQSLFLGAKPRLVYVDTAEGKALVEKFNITVVPAFILDSNIEKAKSWTAIQGLSSYFEKKGDSYKLIDAASGATYFISEEARNKYYASIGVKKGDNKPQIDFFVMSYCPYGNQAEEGIEPVYKLLKDKAEFKPRYVIYSQYGGGGSDYCIDSGNLCSMHGIQELNQDVRELCVNKYMGVGKWFEFALAMNKDCTYKNADSCWEGVASKLKLDVAKIKTCEASEAVALLTAEKALGDKLGVQGSPTIFIDGLQYNGGRTPDAYKTGLCSAYEAEKPAECATALAGNTPQDQAAAPAAGAGCGV